MPMPNRAAELMRMMQGTMGAGGAPQSGVSPDRLAGRMNTLGPAPPPAGRFADNMDPEALHRLMQMMLGTRGMTPGSVGPGGSMADEHYYNWQQNRRDEPMIQSQSTMNRNRALGLPVAPYSVDVETGRRFGASGEPFAQEDPRQIGYQMERTMGQGGHPAGKFNTLLRRGRG